MKISESQIQSAILGYLAAKHVLAFRMNAGAVLASHNGKTRMVRYGVPGMADVLAFPKRIPACPQNRGDGCLTRLHSREWLCNKCSITLEPIPMPLWIECKAPKGKQSELQKSFQQQVESHGHMYVIAKSIEDVKRALEG